jgi:hypothetical protein
VDKPTRNPRAQFADDGLGPPGYKLLCPACQSTRMNQIASAHLFKARTDIVFHCDSCGLVSTLYLVNDGSLTVVGWNDGR